MRNSRLLENGDYQFAFMGDYSIRYLGCHHMLSFNGGENDDDGQEDALITRKQFARFRLCPANKCSRRGGGCKSNYGDYVVDLYTFLKAYTESKERARRSLCENASWECKCDKNRDDDGNVDDNFEYNCESSCYKKRGLKDCLEELEREQYERTYGRDESEFRLEEYSKECRQYGDNRRLENNNNYGYYYVGAYCAKQGGDVYLGMFTDDSCTNFADSTNGADMYKSLTGNTLPYKSKSIVQNDCVTCVEPPRYEDQDDGDDDTVEISDDCMEMYDTAGKCESSMNKDYPIDSACSFIAGLRTLNEKGTPGRTRGGVADLYILFFAGTSFAMSSYAYILYKKLHP